MRRGRSLRWSFGADERGAPGATRAAEPSLLSCRSETRDSRERITDGEALGHQQRGSATSRWRRECGRCAPSRRSGLDASTPNAATEPRFADGSAPHRTKPLWLRMPTRSRLRALGRLGGRRRRCRPHSRTVRRLPRAHPPRFGDLHQLISQVCNCTYRQRATGVPSRGAR